MRARVWAPTAQRVDLVTEERTPLRPDPEAPGWWQGPEVAPGQDYWFSPDGKGPFPDPRSRYQPAGVDGPSRAWAPDTPWEGSPGGSALGGVIYEVHIGTFTSEGTLDAAIERLDDLVDLGVDTVELMPVAQFSGEFGWGYDGVDLFAVHRAYGGPNAYVRFVNEAHKRGLLVCQDVVLNHVGTWGNYLGQFGPYFTERHPTPWGPGFDLDEPEVRRFLIDVCRHWLIDCHVDALRLDAVHAIADDSARHILAELASLVRHWEAQSGRTLTLIAESDLNDVSMIDPNGMGMDGQWADDVHHGLRVAFTGQRKGYYADFADPDALAQVLTRVFYHDGRWSSFRNHHWGAPVPDDVDRRRFVVYSQNHDQVGNRARGERLSEYLSDHQLAGLAALVILGPFTPMLFQGEEWGTRTPFAYFADHPDPERAQLVRQGREEEFAEHGWSGQIPDPTSRDTVRASTLDWTERSEERSHALLSWYRTLIGLRRGAGWSHRALGASNNAHRVQVRGNIVHVLTWPLAVEVSIDGLPLPHETLWPPGRSGRPVRVLASYGGDTPSTRVWEWDWDWDWDWDQ